jgi:hypothetical protein
MSWTCTSTPQLPGFECTQGRLPRPASSACGQDRVVVIVQVRLMRPGHGARMSPDPQRTLHVRRAAVIARVEASMQFASRHESFEGHRGLIVLDDAVTEVHDDIVVVMQHWLARGIDGRRLDAAYAVPAGLWSRVRHLALALVVLFHGRRHAQHQRRRRAGVPRYQGRAWQPLARIIAPCWHRGAGGAESWVGGRVLDAGRNLD